MSRWVPVGWSALAVVTPLLLVAAPAAAQDEQGLGFNISTGYAQLYTDKSGSLLDEEEGWYIDTEFSFQLAPDSPLWLGFAFGGSYFNADKDFVSGGVLVPTETEVWADLALITLEPRVRYVFAPGGRDEPGIYVAPRVGAGLLIADVVASSITELPGGSIEIEGASETEWAFEVRPAIEIGFSGGPWVLGAEASYMIAWMDNDAVGDSLEEMRVGIFFRVAY